MAESWLQVAEEALKIPGLLVEIYGDLAKPGVKQVGRALDTVIGLGNTLLWPIALANEKSRIALEKNLENYRKEMEKVPEEKVVGVSPEVGVPVAEKLSYVADDRLSGLYVKLLATASNAETVGNAHPSFVNVINNMSPDEARLLDYFVTRSTLPFVKAKAVVPKLGSHSFVSGPITSPEAIVGLAFPENIDAYLSNLQGLGLLEVSDDKWLSDESVYASLQAPHQEHYSKMIANSPLFADRTLDFAKGVVTRTSFGKKFIAACHMS